MTLLRRTINTSMLFALDFLIINLCLVLFLSPLAMQVGRIFLFFDMVLLGVEMALGFILVIAIYKGLQALLQRYSIMVVR